MLTVFTTVMTQMIGIVCLLALGYLLGKIKIISSSLSKLCVTVFLPALNLYTFMEECTPENFRIYWVYILIGAGLTALGVLIATLTSKKLAHGDDFLNRIYRYCIAIPNTGSVGTPLVLALFGTNGLFKYTLFLIAQSVVCYSWGVALLLPQKKKENLFKSILGFFNPINVSMIIGCILGLIGAKDYIPDILVQTTNKLGACYSPVVLLTTGAVIGMFGLKSMISDGMSYVITFIRLVVIPLLFLAIVKLCGASQELCTIVLYCYACPNGMNAVIYPASYGGDSKPGAQLYFVSTILAIVTVPLLSMLL